ncbi:MAG: pyruvate, phosphate dikinase [Firmicutes bacterium]|nr:pyruvate, phosphate dikinase [Bacillota bacterium]
MAGKWVYRFSEGSEAMRNLLGGKGAGLAEMTRAGLPVPPGFTITTEACHLYVKEGTLPQEVRQQIDTALADLEREEGRLLGAPEHPLLVSVRSGAPISMPGMMDTVLNLGLNDRSVVGLAQETGDWRFAYDCYRRFLQMYASIVMGVNESLFEEVLAQKRAAAGVKTDAELTAEQLADLIEEYKRIVSEETGSEVPQDPYQQLYGAIEAVFRSWNNPRAKAYRAANEIPESLGTAVNVMRMVYGNMGEDSGTGVCFTRDPNTGEKVLYGEFLPNAQGEDVVAGIRTPLPMEEMERRFPEAYQQLCEVAERLERHYRDVQDLEFTVEHNRLYMLQTRSAKRTAFAAVKIALDMVNEGLIDRDTALLRVSPDQIDQLLHRTLDPNAEKKELAKGLPASPGAGSGEVVFDADRAEALAQQGRQVVLVRPETTPDDVHGVIAAQAVLTSRGGMTSHAAVVARGMGKPCVCGAEEIQIDLAERRFTARGVTIAEGDIITIDGTQGCVYLGRVPTVEPTLSHELETFLSWADQRRHLGIHANADTPQDAARARQLGAEGIGLVRTEHMFMAKDRLPAMQEMILANAPAERAEALAKILPMQEEDFYGIFKAMEGLTVTIRLLDPPLHEFLPRREVLVAQIAALEKSGASAEEIRHHRALLAQVDALHENNPMLGFRGSRLGLVYPEITQMQARAIFQAADRLWQEGGRVKLEIMYPLIGYETEFHEMNRIVSQTAEQIFAQTGRRIPYHVGTMIEVPRAAIIADKLAKECDFFSFGTNDLTQMTLGLSRDDAQGRFLGIYLKRELIPADPFISIDQEGVGALVRFAVQQARQVRPEIELGVCGEHGGEKKSIAFFRRVGLDYVSCSPYRVPGARLAAAQAEIQLEQEKGTQEVPPESVMQPA